MLRKKMRIVGAVGQIGSGKDTVVNYIAAKCSILIISIGDIAREIAKSRGLSPTRQNLQQITEEHYQRFGKTYFIEETTKRIKDAGYKKVLITGIRAPTDVTTLKKLFHNDFILICVIAHERKRFQRLKSREEARDPKTWQEFLAQDRNEEKIFQVSESCELADYAIENNGTLEELLQKIDSVLEEIGW